MHLSNAILLPLLPALASAAQPAQKPLQDKAKGWLNAAKQYIPTAVPTVPGLTAVSKVHNPKPTAKSPIKEAANAVAAKKVQVLNRSNYRSLLTPAPDARGPTEWLVYVTGGNKTCGGHCHNLHVSWNESAAILAADPLAPNLGLIDCDNDRVLCAIWTAKPPTIWHIQRPAPGQALEGREVGKSDIRVNYLNYTTTTASDMVALHTGSKYKDGYLIEHSYHLFDSWLAEKGLLDAFGWVMFLVNLVPSWTIMLTISMVTRTLM